MSLQKHTFKMLKCHFTQDEMTEFRDKLANSIMDLSSIEDEKKSVMSDYTARINEKKAMINRVASNIRNGYEHREVKCLIEYDFTRRVKTFFRDDTGEQVQEEIITAEEAQIEIPGLEPIGNAEADQIIRDVTCPQCGEESVKYPRDSEPYCEDCGWPEDNDLIHVDVRPVDPCDLPEPPCGSDVPSLTNGRVRPLSQRECFFDDEFARAMESAENANRGRVIIREFEDRLNQLQRAAGIEAVVGKVHDKLIVGFSSLTKKDITAICKAVSKADPGIGIIHTAIVEQWPAIQKRWDELLIAENKQLGMKTEN